MNQPPQGQSRLCPTRTDDRPVLFAHRLSVTQCQSRQRGSYHKCYTCAFSNARRAQDPGYSGRNNATAEPSEDRSPRGHSPRGGPLQAAITLAERARG